MGKKVDGLVKVFSKKYQNCHYLDNFMGANIFMDDCINIFLTRLHSKVRVHLPTEKQKIFAGSMGNN